MSHIVELTLMVILGGALGLFYLYGLWVTIRWLENSQFPVLLMFVSFGIRLLLVTLAILLVSQGQWERIAACLTGLTVVRLVVLAWARPTSSEPPA